MVRRPGGRKGAGSMFDVDVLFPQVLEGEVDTWGIDEAMAELLTGFVLALKPKMLLETGTHKGRSTKAIAEGMVKNDLGHLWTVDKKNYGLMSYGAIDDVQEPFVTQVVGETPEVYGIEPFLSLQGIDFAFIDGDHTREGLIEDLRYVDAHRADECLVLVDNARDEGWPEIMEYFNSYTDYPHFAMPTMCGTEIIYMK
jgi:predicted O-methyltransferase YrrM